jgi:hypothetical protein
MPTAHEAVDFKESRPREAHARVPAKIRKASAIMITTTAVSIGIDLSPEIRRQADHGCRKRALISIKSDRRAQVAATTTISPILTGRRS